MKKEIELGILIIILIWIGLVIKDGFRNLPQPDCQFMIPAYQHQLEKEVKEMKGTGTTSDMYNYGWNDALNNVLNQLK